MRISFNERKATQAAARLLELRGGRMSYLKLIKLLYLADREALFQWGRPITTDSYFSMDRGPVLSRVLDLVTGGEDPGAPCIWARHIGTAQNFELQLQQPAGTEELSEAELALLDKVFAEHGSKNRWELVDLTHKLPEWKDPQGGATQITYHDILKAGGKTEFEISCIEDELEGVALAEFTFGTH